VHKPSRARSGGRFLSSAEYAPRGRAQHDGALLEVRDVLCDERQCVPLVWIQFDVARVRVVSHAVVAHPRVVPPQLARVREPRKQLIDCRAR
jgi:hypothetical protein